MIIAWFSIIFSASFWIFLVYRVIILHRSGIKTLTVSTKDSLRNIIGIFVVLGTIFIWTLLFVLSSLQILNLGIFSYYFWNPFNPFYLWINIIGIVWASFFLLIMWIAIITMGKSWRIGIDDKNSGELITHGIFSISRNPIFLGLNGIVISGFVIQPSILFLVFAILTFLANHIQIIKEERSLKILYGEKYEEYCKRTNRYITIRPILS